VPIRAGADGWPVAAPVQRPTCSGCCAEASWCCPKMRAQRWGKDRHIGSWADAFVSGGGHYHATKHERRRFRRLRFELRRLRPYDVIMRETGPEPRPSSARRDGEQADRSDRRRRSLREVPTRPSAAGHKRRLRRTDERGSGGGPDRVAKTIERTLKRRPPAARIQDNTVGQGGPRSPSRRLLPDRAGTLRAPQFPQQD